MVKKVLIVDDDGAMVQTLKQGLIRYDDTFMVLTAEDGLEAVERLKEHTMSIVVTDLKMPRMDGFSLFAYIMEHYPEIPVIIITGFSTPAMERAAKEGGAAGYISKPFMINDLARKIIATLRTDSDGGTLHGISSGMFLQLVEMEEKTCTIRLFSKASDRQGILFFRKGELLDAKTDGLCGEEAAYEIFSWEEVSLSIQNACAHKEKRINRALQAILFEAARRKDDSRSKMKVELGKGEKGGNKPGNKKALSPEAVEGILAKNFAEGAGVEDIYQDEVWKDLVQEVQRLAGLLKAGDFKAAYVDRGEAHDFIILPGERVTVVSVNPKCPRDRLVETLSELS
jgi:CheY-like chemotaxis protein